MPRISRLTWNAAGPGQAVGQYVLGRVGTLRAEGAWSGAIAQGGDQRWHFKAGSKSVVVTAADRGAHAVGEYRSGTLHWGSRELRLGRAPGGDGFWHWFLPDFSGERRYALSDDGQIVALLWSGRDWRLNPVDIQLVNATEADAGPLLLAAFVVAWLAMLDRNNDGL